MPTSTILQQFDKIYLYLATLRKPSLLPLRRKTAYQHLPLHHRVMCLLLHSGNQLETYSSEHPRLTAQTRTKRKSAILSRQEETTCRSAKSGTCSSLATAYTELAHFLKPDGISFPAFCARQRAHTMYSNLELPALSTNRNLFNARRIYVICLIRPSHRDFSRYKPTSRCNLCSSTTPSSYPETRKHRSTFPNNLNIHEV